MAISYDHEIRFDTHADDYREVLLIEEIARRKRTELFRDMFRRGLEAWKAEYSHLLPKEGPHQGTTSAG